jgi:Spy/CpxP family protein refolding chaperone
MKSKLSKKIGTGLVVLLITVCFIPAMAGAFGPGDRRHGKGFGHRGHHRNALGIWQNPQMIQNLNLTDDQVKKIRDADFASREKCLELKGQLDSLRLKMDKAFSEDNVDDAAVLSLAEKISDLKGKLFVRNVESRLTLGKLLNAEQLEKLKQHQMQQKKRGRSRGHKFISKGNAFEKPGNVKRLTN